MPSPGLKVHREVTHLPSRGGLPGQGLGPRRFRHVEIWPHRRIHPNSHRLRPDNGLARRLSGILPSDLEFDDTGARL